MQLCVVPQAEIQQVFLIIMHSADVVVTKLSRQLIDWVYIYDDT